MRRFSTAARFFTRLAGMAAFAALLGGCTTVLSLREIDPAALGTDKALLIVSGGTDAPCKFDPAQAIVKKAGHAPILGSTLVTVPITNAYEKSDVPDEFVKVRAVALPPGDYDLWLHALNVLQRFVQPVFTRKFTLRPGETLYVGQVVGSGCAGALRVAVRDRFDRDLAYLRSIDPRIDPTRVRRELLVVER